APVETHHDAVAALPHHEARGDAEEIRMAPLDGPADLLRDADAVPGHPHRGPEIRIEPMPKLRHDILPEVHGEPAGHPSFDDDVRRGSARARREEIVSRLVKLGCG